MTFIDAFPPLRLPIGERRWKPATIQVARVVDGDTKIGLREGAAWAGIGIIYRSATSTQTGENGTMLDLIHLGSGHCVAMVLLTYAGAEVQPMTAALDMAADLAQSSDWTFGGLDGWRNADPELETKCLAWNHRHAPLGALAVGNTPANPETAQRIAMSRWGNG